jgi:hypothetical protein
MSGWVKVITRSGWLDPSDDRYDDVLADLRTFPAIEEFLDRIVLHDEYDTPEDAMAPQIVLGHKRPLWLSRRSVTLRHQIELTWCNIVAVFRLNGDGTEYVLDAWSSDISPEYVRADGKIMVLV